MKQADRTLWRRVAVHAALSAALWLAGVVVAWGYLHRMTPEEYRGGLRTLTDPDSYGLPLVAFATALGVLVVGVNLIVAAVLALRRRRAS
jgi:hypothetical protein